MSQPRDAALMAEYMRAVEAAQSGRWCESADAYLAAYLLPACVQWDGNWHVWSGFPSIIRDDRFPASEAHLRALKRVGSGSGYPVLHRAQAHLTRGLARWGAGNREEAARDYHAAIQVVAQATRAERAERVWNTGANPDGSFGMVWQSVGDQVDGIRDDARANLDRMRGGGDAASNAEAMAEAIAEGERRGTQNSIRTMGGGLGPLGNFQENEAALLDAMARLNVGGDKCDQCGEAASEAERLKRCGRCQLAYYCSPVCARAAWVVGHKHACRAPGQFEVGDKAQIQGVLSRPEINGDIVEVRGPAPSDSGRLAVAVIGGDTEFSLKPVNLRRLRPSA